MELKRLGERSHMFFKFDDWKGWRNWYMQALPNHSPLGHLTTEMYIVNNEHGSTRKLSWFRCFSEHVEGYRGFNRSCVLVKHNVLASCQNHNDFMTWAEDELLKRMYSSSFSVHLRWLFHKLLVYFLWLPRIHNPQYAQLDKIS
jgi:hypothetical protein